MVPVEAGLGRWLSPCQRQYARIDLSTVPGVDDSELLTPTSCDYLMAGSMYVTPTTQRYTMRDFVTELRKLLSE